MKNTFVLVAFCFTSFICFSQETTDNTRSAIKIYNLSTVERYYVQVAPDSSENYLDIQILHPTIAFQWYNAKGNSHEIELTRFELSRSEIKRHQPIVNLPLGAPYKPEMTLSSSTISLRYEYIWNINKTSTAKILPSLGFAINPYYLLDHYEPQVSTIYSETHSSLGARFFLIPRLNYFISDRIFLDINLPISVIDHKYLIKKTEDPTIELAFRQSSSIESESFAPLFSARVGLGIRL